MIVIRLLLIFGRNVTLYETNFPSYEINQLR